MINDDSLVEGTEDLVLLLFSDDEAVVINTPLQVIIIEDNDGQWNLEKLQAPFMFYLA